MDAPEYVPTPFEPGTVAAAYLHTGTVQHVFMESLINVINADVRGPRTMRALIAISDAYIPSGRCEAVLKFLETECEWLWFLDYDIQFSTDVLPRMLETADADERPIVSALYVAHFYDDFRPCWMMADGGVISTDEYKTRREDPLKWPLELAGCGMGCTLIHRSVLEKVAARCSDDPWPWFGHDVVAKAEGGITRFGEDFTFCFRARACGASIWGVPIEVGHRKAVVMTPDMELGPQLV